MKEPENNYISLSSKTVLGAVDAVSLYEKNESERRCILHLHRKNGVHIPCADGVQISPFAKIGRDSVILSGTIIGGQVTIGEGCTIGPNSLIENSSVGDFCQIEFSCCREAQIKDGASLGPFVHLRPGSVIGEDVHVGNFTEIKNSHIGRGSKLSHLSYIGDCDVGQGVNVGCGVVTANYDGKNKSTSIIADHAFIGCNTILIAPVKVGEFAYTAAGSVITKDVPTCSLAISRSEQQNKEDWVRRKMPYKNKNPD